MNQNKTKIKTHNERKIQSVDFSNKLCKQNPSLFSEGTFSRTHSTLPVAFLLNISVVKLLDVSQAMCLQAIVNAIYENKIALCDNFIGQYFL